MSLNQPRPDSADSKVVLSGGFTSLRKLSLGTIDSRRVPNELAGIEEQGQSVVAVGHKPDADCAGQVLGIVGVGDTMRPDAPEAIPNLHASGVQKVVMLSDDNQRPVNAIARQAGVDVA